MSFLDEPSRRLTTQLGEKTVSCEYLPNRCRVSRGRTEFQPEEISSCAATINESGHRIPRSICDASWRALVSRAVLVFMHV
ncbi:hypothetical protein BJX66DRAFT_318788 [Aspergillus keveii]|uniref:Uncharacterized protein n=1 Tax=Aspergillus keveii TaxID=714993 RepID=A0ABR4FJT7_9EURO